LIEPLKSTKRFWLALAAVCSLATYLLATTTNYTQAFDSGHGWTYNQLACGGTCSNGDVSGDGNPADSVFSKVTGRNKQQTGYWSKTFTWEDLGVPVGDTVDTVDGQWDSKVISTAVACTSSTTAGVQIFDNADTTEATASAVEPSIDVSGDSSWTNHNPTGAISVNASYQASSTTVTLRAHSNPDAGNNGSAACELRYDSYKLTIESTTPSGRSRVVMISQRF
jgi:hypothetical protein